MASNSNKAAEKKAAEQTEKDFQAIEGALTKTESFIEKNQRLLLIILGAIVAVVAVWMLLKNFYFEPREVEAQDNLAIAQNYFAAQNYETALNGDSVSFDGLLALKDAYGSTKAGNLADAYIGFCYYRLGQYEDAINYLLDFNGKDDVVRYTALGTVGDCYVQLDQKDLAIKYFLKAADNDNVLVAPVYLVKAGLVYEAQGNYAEALKLYQQVKNDFSGVQRGVPEVDEIDKYIAAAQAANGK